MGRGVPAAAGSRGRSAPVPQLARPPAATITGSRCVPARDRVFSVRIVGFFPVWTFGPWVRVYVLNGSGCPTCVCHRLSFSQYSNSFSSFHFPDDTEQCFLWETCRTGRHVERVREKPPLSQPAGPAGRVRVPCAPLGAGGTPSLAGLSGPGSAAREQRPLLSGSLLPAGPSGHVLRSGQAGIWVRILPLSGSHSGARPPLLV